MPLGEGWFIDLDTDEALPIAEHATDVKERPERYRLRPCDVSGVSVHAGQGRERILRAALAQGFVRVRSHRGVATFEYAHPDRLHVLAAIIRFLADKGFGEATRVRIGDVDRPEDRLECPAAALASPGLLAEKLGQGSPAVPYLAELFDAARCLAACLGIAEASPSRQEDLRRFPGTLAQDLEPELGAALDDALYPRQVAAGSAARAKKAATRSPCPSAVSRPASAVSAATCGSI